MKAVGQYIITISAAAMLCSIFSILIPDNSSGKTVKLLCRIFLMISIIRPFIGTVLPEMPLKEWENYLDASDEIYAGEDYARRNKMEFIKQELESYIEDKASSWSESLSVEIHLREEDMMPQDIVIAGMITPEQKVYLEKLVQNDLGITKENQMWIGTN